MGIIKNHTLSHNRCEIIWAGVLYYIHNNQGEKWFECYLMVPLNSNH